MTTASAQPPAREPRTRERTRERLIEAAFEIFSEQGLAAPSVETIAERAGFTRGAFYSNFESKEELFFAIADEQYERSAALLRERIDIVLAELLPPGTAMSESTIENVVVQVLAMTTAKPHWMLFDAEFELLALRDPSIAQRYASRQAQVVAGFTRLLSEALGRVGVRFVLPPEQATRMLLATFSAAVRAHLLAGGAMDVVPASAASDVAALAYRLTERASA